MAGIEYTDVEQYDWQTVAEGLTKVILRSAPGENRVLIKIEAGKNFQSHTHNVPDEVYVVDGVYIDPGVEGGRAFGAGSYLYYPAGTTHCATMPSGCTILVWNANNPK